MAADDRKDEGFVRGLGLFDSTMVVAGSMIGSGIFIVSADIARQTGSPGGLLLTWIITGLLTILAALSYGELAAMMPKAGGQYVYLRESYSPLWGFLYGWTLFLVIRGSDSEYLSRKLHYPASSFISKLCCISFYTAIGSNIFDNLSYSYKHSRVSSGQTNSECVHIG
jgi:amino acid permease